MNNTLEQVINLIKPHGDSLVPLEVIKQCLQVLSNDEQTFIRHSELLRSQISIWGSDDTQMFSRQLTANTLIDELESLR